MSLVEVMVAIAVMTVGIYILSSTVTTAVAHTISTRERAIAIEAAGNVLEEMRAQPYSEVFALYNADPNDDPAGLGSGPGNTFDVDGLDPVTILDDQGQPTVQPVGMIVLPAGSAPLREDVDLAALGMPRDLDGDLQIDAEDHARDYLVLPVQVVVRWRSKSGPRTFSMQTIFADLGKL